MDDDKIYFRGEGRQPRPPKQKLESKAELFAAIRYAATRGGPSAMSELFTRMSVTDFSTFHDPRARAQL